jgi:16S rRNA (cytosine967-C5)-methyltransferase
MSNHQGRTTSARACALSTVSEVLFQHRDLQACLNRHLSSAGLSPEDAHLATRISYEYLRYKGRLDHILEHLCTRGAARLPARLRLILGLGCYEILFLDRVPPYASVNWAVNRVKKEFSSKLGGLANGILRNVARETQSLNSYAFFTRDNPGQLTALSRWYSCPEWIVDLLLGSLGETGCTSLLAASLQPPPVGLRLHPVKGAQIRQRLVSHPGLVQESPSGMAFSRTPDQGIAAWEMQGLLSRQSMAVQDILHDLGFAAWPAPVWDACAGNGGKTCLLREYGTSRVWSSDIGWSRVDHCRRDLNRLGLDSRLVFVADATQPGPFREPPGTVLLDVPCSGLGVLSRRPDIKWKRKPEDVSAMLRTQERMLNSACESLQSGGRLVYVTCTVNREENEGRIEALLARRPDQIVLNRVAPADPASALRETLFGAELEKV